MPGDKRNGENERRRTKERGNYISNVKRKTAQQQLRQERNIIRAVQETGDPLAESYI